MNRIHKASILVLMAIFALGGIALRGYPDELESNAGFHQEKDVGPKEETGKAEEVTLISVYDNTQVNPELQTGWGFGTVVKTSQETLLFDTGGDSEILLANMEKMKIGPESIDKVMISHIHGDHLGGLKGFLEVNDHVTVYIPSSFPRGVKEMITKQGAEVVEISKPQSISGCLYSTGELVGPPQEQSLLIHTTKGLIVMTGCAHPGIETIVKKAKEIFSEQKVVLAIGGFHRPSPAVVKGLRALGVEKVAPSHCTGDRAIEAFKKEYGDDFIAYGVGKIIEIN